MTSRTLIVGDVHGCADELAALIELADAERVVLVGDLFTKGPDPAGVFAIARQHESVLGNHDQRLLACVDGKRKNDAGGHACIQALGDLPWEPWLRALPVVLKVGRYKVVHAGLDPDAPKKTTRGQAMNLRRHPAGGPFWWQRYEGKRGVVFGHDAARGLIRVERAGQPYLLGLDTGCVYGNRLTGWLMEEDRYLQIPAKRVYLAVD